MPAHGIKFDNVTMDLKMMLDYKNKAVFGLTGGIEFLFKKYNVKYVKGFGKITSPNEVSVTLNEGGTKSLSTKNIVIATGSDVTNLPFLKIDEKRIVSSTGALDLAAVPKRMTVIGGGIIGLEMGSVWRRLGSEVTVVEFTPAICGGADAEVAKDFLRILTKQGMKFKLNTKVTAANVTDSEITLTTETTDTKKQEQLAADVVLVSVGRRPYTDGLGLEGVGVKVDERGRIPVDHHFRTNVPSICAIGDCIPGPMLAHKAEEDGIACIETLAGGVGHVDYNTVPALCTRTPRSRGSVPRKKNSRRRASNIASANSRSRRIAGRGQTTMTKGLLNIWRMPRQTRCLAAT